MADNAPNEDVAITFNVKSSNDTKYSITLPLSNTVLQLKEKLSSKDFADLPPERQRLIYSGRVLKDADTLNSYKIKEGNTVHLVKGAASNQRQNPANQSAASAESASNVPQNMASGAGANNMLAGLTGARYAGLANLPNANMFGPDGGMGPPPDPEQIISMLENPAFASTLNEALSNPQVIDTMIQQNPMLRNMGPEMRQMMQSPEFRRMMTDPQMMRQTMQMQRMFGGGGLGGLGGQQGNTAFPAPGTTDTTEGGAEANRGGQGSQAQSSQQQQQNPFALLNNSGMNPFAQLFNPSNMGGNPGASTSSASASDGQSAPSNTQGASSGPDSNQQSEQQQTQGQQQQQSPNPFANLTNNPLFQNPQLMADMMQAMYPSPNNNSTDNAGSSQQTNHTQQNPFAALVQAMGGAGGVGPGFNPWTFGGGSPPPNNPADNRPPEERYAEQLRQLNDMGFYEFERNIEALRRSGGSVQGAVEYLLNHPPS